MLHLGKTDFSGFNREEWVLRSLQQHKSAVKEVLKQTTKTAQSTAESQHGVRYSVLLELPYFDPVECIAIDIYSWEWGNVFSVWIETGILTKTS